MSSILAAALSLPLQVQLLKNDKTKFLVTAKEWTKKYVCNLAPLCLLIFSAKIRDVTSVKATTCTEWQCHIYLICDLLHGVSALSFNESLERNPETPENLSVHMIYTTLTPGT